MNKTPKTYFLSTGRSGTSFLFNFFSNFYPEFAITHQTRWSRIINILANSSFGIKNQGKFIRIILKLLKKESIPENTLDPLLSILLCLLVKHKEIKNINIVHLVRDPRDFVISFMNWKSSSIKKRILHYLVPFWQPFPQGNSISILRWIFMSKFEKYCWTWYYKNSLFKKLKKSTNYRLIRIEDLTKSPIKYDHINKLIRYLKLKEKYFDYQSISATPVNKSEKKSFPPYNYWSQKQKNCMQKICGNLMIEFGYNL